MMKLVDDTPLRTIKKFRARVPITGGYINLFVKAGSRERALELLQEGLPDDEMFESIEWEVGDNDLEEE